MCGILGQISNKNIDEKIFYNELFKLNHRGPDDNGIFIDKNVALGHTRLSIIDLSDLAHQPMISECGRYIVVYNGEIYNYKDIKKDLEKKGYFFRSHSDTEVILNGFIEYKEEISDRLNGMFAIAIYDKLSKELFLLRDRSGMKPLYYFKNYQNFVFSSELKCLVGYSKIYNIEAKILFLLLGYVPEPLTIYDKISSFPAGHYAFFKDGQLKFYKFDEYKFEPKIKKPYREIISDIRTLFNQSIQRHLISDAPLGIFLSGGVDSSLLTAVASQYKQNLHTLSIIFTEDRLNEEYFQDLIVKKYNTKHKKYLIEEKSFLEEIDNFFQTMEQPTIDGLNTYFISKAARECGLKAVFSGIGSDEIFYGYPSFKDVRILKSMHNFKFIFANLSKFSNKYKKLELLKADEDLAYYLPKRGLFTPYEISKILKINIKEIYESISKLWSWYNTTFIKDLEDKISFFELNMYMKNQLLRDADLFGMANSIEIRVPFLDKELLNYTLRVESKHKIGKTNKQLLIDIFKDLLPDEIFKRPKMGFTLPYENWFKNNIDKFNIDDDIKSKFKNKKLHWSRFLAILILRRYDEK